jgi:DNA repair protein RecN (Recombination protein N)
MLQTLRVKNLALVENVRVDFQPGLNVITGETGAGKSILIGALALLLGERADRKVIRTGEDTCGAEAVFQLVNTRAVDALLDELGAPPCEDGVLIVRRIVRAEGSGQNLVNDAPVTLQALKRLGELLVDLHGPHEHQSLLNTAFQLDILDAYGHTDDERAAYGRVFEQLRELEARKAELAASGDVTVQMDVLSYRIKEIEDAAPVEGEAEKIEEEHRIISNAQRILDLGGGITRALSDSEASALDLLASVQRNLEELARLLPEADNWKAEAKSIAIQVKELGATISGVLDNVEGEPARLELIEQRMAAYQKLKRKYAASVPEVLALLEESRARLRDLQTRDVQLQEIEQRIASTTADLLKTGGALREKRRAAADKLGKAVTKELRGLGFPHGLFSADLVEAAPKAGGLDDAEFGFAPNVGEAMKPLREIASSGEISRVMLATKAVLSGHDRIPVLIFDEIDANLGGEMGNAVGAKLAELAGKHQVICITHLPQVAIHGASHFAVTKSVRDGRTVTQVGRVEDQARIEEVARMLGGRDLTRVTLQHARELLARAGS